PVVDIAAGSNFMVVLLQSGEIRGWGVTKDGSLGDIPSSKESRGKCFPLAACWSTPMGLSLAEYLQAAQLGLPHCLVDELTKIGEMEVASIVASNNQTIFVDVNGEVTAC
ncbi:hypothetical protein HDU67_005223, partial [Dinochytrium kinnereticum]